MFVIFQVSIVTVEVGEELKNSIKDLTYPSCSVVNLKNENIVTNELDNTKLIAASCEKADLEQHEKESPSDEDNIGTHCLLHEKEMSNLKLDDDDDDDDSISRIKLHKTHENKAMITSNSYSPQIESHLKRNKMNENNSVISSCSNLTSDSNEFCTKIDKTNENISVVVGSITEFQANSLTTSLSSGNTLDDDEQNNLVKKSASVSENLTLLQNSEMKHMSTTNCDHKTNLNIANAMFIEAEKSCHKMKTNSAKNNNPLSLNDRPLSLMKQNPNCDYRVRCYRFRNFLGLPGK